MTDLHVEVQGDYIIITLPGTKLMVTYYKAGDPPQLMAKSDWTDDPDAPITPGGVSSTGIVSSQRQGARAGVDRVGCPGELSHRGRALSSREKEFKAKPGPYRLQALQVRGGRHPLRD